MKQKHFVLGLALMGITLSAQAAEHIYCADRYERYTVNFNLDDDVATDLVFKDGERLIAQYGSVEAHTSRIFKTKYYEFNLGGVQYFDFERYRGSNVFYGAFFFGVSPLRFEVEVQCVAGVRSF